MNAPSFDVIRAHRWFACELNNLAWDLVEADVRSAEEVERMIHAAHGACFHWSQIGDLITHLRAQCLLATAYAKAGLSEGAVRHAERCLALSREAGETQTPFDRASAHGCAAAAYVLAGRMEQAGAQRQSTAEAVQQLADDAERRLIERLYPTRL